MMKAGIFCLALALQCSLGYSQVADAPENVAPLLIGEKVPDLTNASGSLLEQLNEQAAVLLVYRGGWCPYCNAHLKAVAQMEEEIRALGYQIIGVAPDTQEELLATADKNKLHYSLYSDASTQWIQKMGLAFQAPTRYENKLNNFSGGLNTGVLPVPALFVVNTKGEILFEYINPDYSKRMTPELLKSVLEGM